jgi:hypothetical protein
MHGGGEVSFLRCSEEETVFANLSCFKLTFYAFKVEPSAFLSFALARRASLGDS